MQIRDLSRQAHPIVDRGGIDGCCRPSSSETSAATRKQKENWVSECVVLVEEDRWLFAGRGGFLRWTCPYLALYLGWEWQDVFIFALVSLCEEYFSHAFPLSWETRPAVGSQWGFYGHETPTSPSCLMCTDATTTRSKIYQEPLDTKRFKMALKVSVKVSGFSGIDRVSPDQIDIFANFRPSPLFRSGSTDPFGHFLGSIFTGIHPLATCEMTVDSVQI
ncbi:uncharacterized protein LACBIDRAFT_332906 [Laccaria bicolor S238N-H82]|uniref:Predicted protein n=1 Tax=Laccaria bicolor (strain S238N-H82 / ATCC MYA-4686) TaxID=486041 RepID=B0DU83_LACBS|nr:uncharacterized protein LACBIDRAFT_332906 [Laccaria bicolor S238N-H82]EDR01904.1 predicted protein [Laccaria bicolor S238N-H82]|eukprot:XP_001887514.1 predicted protein [Laccaria bicolor S238N-H82]